MRLRLFKKRVLSHFPCLPFRLLLSRNKKKQKRRYLNGETWNFCVDGGELYLIVVKLKIRDVLMNINPLTKFRVASHT